jgi:hypothetical protein
MCKFLKAMQGGINKDIEFDQYKNELHIKGIASEAKITLDEIDSGAVWDAMELFKLFAERYGLSELETAHFFFANLSEPVQDELVIILGTHED